MAIHSQKQIRITGTGIAVARPVDEGTAPNLHGDIVPKTNAVQRSLKSLRKNGWTCHIVEKFLPARGSMKFPRRIDAFGVGDILAMRPPMNGLPGSIALVQCCPGASHAEHEDKILAIPEFDIWKKSGGRVFLQSWSKKGARGEKKKWTMREEEL